MTLSHVSSINIALVIVVIIIIIILLDVSIILLLSPKGDTFYRSMECRKLRWPRWLVTYRNGLPTRKWSPIQVLTGSGVELDYLPLNKTIMTRARTQNKNVKLLLLLLLLLLLE